MDSTRRVPADAAPLGVGALPVAQFLVQVVAVGRLRAEPRFDRVAAKIEKQNGRQEPQLASQSGHFGRISRNCLKNQNPSSKLIGLSRQIFVGH